MGDIGTERREVEFQPVDDPVPPPDRTAPQPSVPAPAAPVPAAPVSG